MGKIEKVVIALRLAYSARGTRETQENQNREDPDTGCGHRLGHAQRRFIFTTRSFCPQAPFVPMDQGLHSERY
jgi:hypothetical protein